MAKAKKGRRGRPPVPAMEQRRNKISVRVRDDLYQWLERGSKAANLPLSELCESLIRSAFERASKGQGHDEYFTLELDRVKRDYEELRKLYESLGEIVRKAKP